MSCDEREQWRDQLQAGDWIDRDTVIMAILDRVEQLEREMAEARASRHCGKIVAHGTGRRCLGCGDAWHSTIPHEKDIHA